MVSYILIFTFLGGKNRKIYRGEIITRDLQEDLKVMSSNLAHIKFFCLIKNNLNITIITIVIFFQYCCCYMYQDEDGPRSPGSAPASPAGSQHSRSRSRSPSSRSGSPAGSQRSRLPSPSGSHRYVPPIVLLLLLDMIQYFRVILFVAIYCNFVPSSCSGCLAATHLKLSKFESGIESRRTRPLGAGLDISSMYSSM